MRFLSMFCDNEAIRTLMDDVRLGIVDAPRALRSISEMVAGGRITMKDARFLMAEVEFIRRRESGSRVPKY